MREGIAGTDLITQLPAPASVVVPSTPARLRRAGVPTSAGLGLTSTPIPWARTGRTSRPAQQTNSAGPGDGLSVDEGVRGAPRVSQAAHRTTSAGEAQAASAGRP